MTGNGENLSYKYNFDTSKTFVDSIQIEPITNTTAVIINEQSKEYLEKLMQALIIKISEVNKTQMQQLGITEMQHPLINSTPIGFIAMYNKQIIDSSKNNAYYYEYENITQEPLDSDGQNTEIMYDYTDTSNQIESTAIQQFNSKFEMYQGTKGSSIVKSLISTVISSNLNSEHKVTVNGFTNEQDIEQLLQYIDNSRTYEVTITKDINGYINNIQIN